MSDVSLESLSELFKEWRSKRCSRAERIPEVLWSRALELYPRYKRSIICRCLRLSGAQFKARLEKHVSRESNNGFVLASVDKVNNSIEVVSSKIQLIVQGEKRSLTLCFDMNALAEVLPHMSDLL